MKRTSSAATRSSGSRDTGPGAMQREVLDEDARLGDGRIAVDEHREAAERPERGALVAGARVLEMAVDERRAVLP